MYKTGLRFAAIAVFSILLISCSEKETHCTLKGSILDRDSDTIYLCKVTEDVRFQGIPIPITDNQFEYSLKIPAPEAYELIFQDELFNGAWRPILFFAEDGTIEFELFPIERHNENEISGGVENKTYQKYLNTYDSIFADRFQPFKDQSSELFQNGGYFSTEMNALQQRLRDTENMDTLTVIYGEMNKLRKTGMDLSSEAMKIQNKVDEINNEVIEWQYKLISDQPSIATYYLLINELQYKDGLNSLKKQHIKQVYPELSERYPNHPYTKVVADYINAMDHIVVGGQFIDFSAPDLDGNLVQLSNIVKQNKVTLLDLWASWCGPCMSKAKSMIPVYEEFNDKGFGVLGVAREFNDTKAMEGAIERLEFPWINLVELEDENNIWRKYDIAFSGGGTFLILNNGEIIAKDPSADEVRTHLERLLK